MKAGVITVKKSEFIASQYFTENNNNISHYYCFYDQINAVLVIMEDFFQTFE